MRRLSLQLLGGTLVSTALPRVRADTPAVAVYADDMLGRYGFGEGHPLGIDRQGAFLEEAAAQGLLAQTTRAASRVATQAELARFHTDDYIEHVATAESRGVRLLDDGDTPVFPDMFPTSASVVGAALDGLERIMSGACRRSLQPIGGLHHAARAHAAGFCVFNDVGVVIETLRASYDIRRIAYVDIDAHHGDGIFYAFEDDADLVFADIHQDSRTLFPGTGRADETGKGDAAGTKLNIELPPHAGDDQFLSAWARVEAHVERYAPEFILFQCGADSQRGDPLAQLAYTPATHAHATRRLCALAARHAGGRLMAFGGGGYARRNLALAWSAVLRELIAAA